MSVYDWTTASFARVVFMKVFQYTDIKENPFPIDKPSITNMIWESNWQSYVPQNEDYMRTFLMTPANTEADVQAQLDKVSARLHQFSDVHNRLLAAAMHSLPRTPVMAKPRLFSGQVDIYQFGLERFGVEFLECPLNAGPVGTALTMPFASALSSVVATGRVVTTKMVWSFTDALEDAMHYSNGIVLVANPPGDSWVWDATL